MEGLTGLQSFDKGRRQQLHLDILQLKPTGLEKVCEVLRLTLPQ